MTDWPALLKRLRSRRIHVIQALRVNRSTVWRWEQGVAVPHGDHAAALLLLDDETEEQRAERERA